MPKTRAKWHIQHVFKDMDRFAKKIPAFNIQGDESVKTHFGGILTIFIMIITLLFAVDRFIDLIRKEDPSVNENSIQDFLGMEEDINFNTIG